MSEERIEVNKHIKDVQRIAQSFSSEDNPELSLIGKRWYYYSEDEKTYYFHYDEITDITEEGIYIDIYMEVGNEERKENPSPIFLSWKDYKNVYPINKDIDTPLNDEKEAFDLLEKCND
ncbi:hypothetical protein [Tetragenococcus halophilus]|uniref:hypothetical protein n=1 Tax=Tetragenococcus halophilus TaxID=51669 RepID=UPI00300F84B8